jgi:predicted nuclease of predicted toxin-antitoxin system
VKLLFDQNLSPFLVPRLSDLFPGSLHVQAIGLDSASDLSVWEYAYRNNLIIVTKDADFTDLSVVLGFPPKVIWIGRGNCSTQSIESTLRDHFESIRILFDNSDTGVLSLF